MARLSAIAAGALLGSGTSGQVAVFDADGRLNGTSVLTVGAAVVTIGATSSTATHVMRGSELQAITNAGTTSFLIYRNVDTGAIRLLGGAGASAGSVELYGNSHATKPGNIEIGNNSGLVFQVNQAGKATVGLATQILRINSTTTAAGAATATMTNAPAGAAGNPDIWLNLDFNGTAVVVPGWTP